LISHALESAGKKVLLAGNIGEPMLSLLPKTENVDWVVLELSSFQIIDVPISPKIVVITNITTDHMDWHKNQEEYINAKKNIVRYQKQKDYLIVNSEYKSSIDFADETKANIIYVSKKTLDKKFKNGTTLRGEHNQENIVMAVEVARILNINEEKIEKVVIGFKGLEHRLEFVNEVVGIKFYNDSFATGPQPTIAAVNSFTEPETLILGGSDKGLNYQELGDVVNKTKNIKNVVLIGVTGPIINKYLDSNLQFTIYNLQKTNMEEIVKKTFDITPKGGVIVLSPASASFDMFKNYKDRGNQFKKAVQSLLNEQK